MHDAIHGTICTAAGGAIGALKVSDRDSGAHWQAARRRAHNLKCVCGSACVNVNVNELRLGFSVCVWAHTLGHTIHTQRAHSVEESNTGRVVASPDRSRYVRAGRLRVVKVLTSP
jgi:hypothetical protein